MLDVILGNPILLALAALVGMAIAFGALLGFAAVRFEVEGNPLSDQINQYCPRPNVVSAATPDAGPTLRRLPTVTRLISVLQVVKTQFRRWPICSTLNRNHWTPNTVSKLSPRLRTSARTSASAAPNAYKRVLWMPFSVLRSSCTQ